MIHCPYKYGFYWKDHNLLVCHPKGELTTDRVNDISICRECIIKAGLSQVNRFHNLTDITSINLNFDEVSKICEIEAKLRENSKSIKACYLVQNPLLYGTIRMYQSLIESCGVDVHVSYNIDELADVLEVEKSVLIPEHHQ